MDWAFHRWTRDRLKMPFGSLMLNWKKTQQGRKLVLKAGHRHTWFPRKTNLCRHMAPHSFDVNSTFIYVIHLRAYILSALHIYAATGRDLKIIWCKYTFTLAACKKAGDSSWMSVTPSPKIEVRIPQNGWILRKQLIYWLHPTLHWLMRALMNL